MNRLKLAASFSIGALLLLLPATPSSAQTACAEGRTFAGACVNVGLAQSMRKQAIIFSLPKFSYTAPPLLPREDGEYYILRDYHELQLLFGAENAVVCPPSTPSHATSC
jgi:hypothetical protein